MNSLPPVDRQARLGIIHFLGWMLGCTIVLAILRAFWDLEQATELQRFRSQLSQLGFGLAYGTALAGLGLFLWRWWVGEGPAPTQPGHWLLLFGGIGMVIDFGTTAALAAIFRVLGYQPNDWRIGNWQLAIGCSTGTVIALIVLSRLRHAPRLWTVFVAVTAFMLAAAAVVNMIALVCLAQGVRGQWPWYLRAYSIAAWGPVLLPLLWVAETADRIRRAQRDWLHGAGIATITGLGVVGFLSWLPAAWP